jgi:hypothetical protein
MTTNRRAYDRADYSAPVQCVADGELVFGNVIDISEGGARLRTRTTMPAAEVIKLFVPLPGERDAKRLCFVEGRRVWATDDEMGVEFLEPSADTLVDIARAVAAA